MLPVVPAAAAELERRYRDGQAVYEEDMLHRQPGDASSLAAAELPFTQPQALLQEEVRHQQSVLCSVCCHAACI
jgi:hypothetical protein